MRLALTLALLLLTSAALAQAPQQPQPIPPFYPTYQPLPQPPPPTPRDATDDQDPSALTTAVILRATAALKELIFTRLDAMDKALVLLQSRADKVPSDIDIAVGAIRAVYDEKFKSVALQFSERDVRTEQTSRDSKVAVDAALQAAKEAVGEQNKSSALAIAKSEAATTKQIDQIVILINATNASINDKVDDLKNRLSSIESRLEKGEGRGVGQTDVVAYIVAGFSLLGTIVAIIVGGMAISRANATPRPNGNGRA
jgi:hypothetical protein